MTARARGTTAATEPTAATLPADRDEAAQPGRYEQLLVAQLATVDAVVGFVVRRHRLSADEAEEFAAHVRLKLIEDEYAVLRKFEGRASLRTYLTVVIQRLFLDYRVALWGRWRPSAAARREGPIAVLLERLTMRQGLTFDQACDVLERVHQVSIGRPALETLYERLPSRTRRCFVSEDALRDVPAPDGDPASRLSDVRDASTAARTSEALAAALSGLHPDDLQVIALRFGDGMTIADIARTTSQDPRALYRRVRHLLDRLRVRLEAYGLSRSEVLRLVGREGVELPEMLSSPPFTRSPAELRQG